MPRMIHVLRKPLSEGTVASNVLKHGTGGLNIDASRISFRSEADERESKTKNQHGDFGTTSHAVLYGDYSGVPHKNYTATGRWPANVILQHLDGCRCEGTKRVSCSAGGVSTTMLGFMNDDGWKPRPTVHERSWRGLDGKETVANWICEPGCPVARLDEQSGITTNTSHYSYKRSGGDFIDNIPDQTANRHWRTETGGASRFYKQVGGAKVPE